MEKISNSIIVHGPGRSGTTLLANILSLHNDLCWVSNYVNKFPKHLYLSVLNRTIESSSFEQWSRHKKQFPRPSEAYNFWLHYIPEFNKSSLDNISATSTENGIKAIQSIQNYSGKTRFITKVTGFSRHQTISALFENPKILWINRNPLSVIASFYKQKWNYKNKIELFENTPKQELLRFYTNKYISFINDRDKLSNFPMKIVNYEDMVEDPITFFEDICSFMDLSFTDKFRNIVLDWNINTTANLGYKKYLSSSDEAFIQSILKKTN